MPSSRRWSAGANLRLRIALVCSVLNLVLGVVFGAAVYWQNERLEHGIVEATLKRTLDGVLVGGAPLRSARLPSGLDYYRAERGGLPAHLRDLAPGMHEIDAAGRSFEVLVRDAAGARHIVVLDETRYDLLENRMYALALMLIAAVVVTAGVGAYFAAGRALAPLNEFARRVERLGPGADGPPLQPDYAGTEVAGVAAALDRYRVRLDGFIEREREFTANASHELRTPLAVIQGAGELLQVPGLDEQRRRNAVARIDHAGRQMAELLDVLLLLAREDRGEAAHGGDGCRVEEVAAELVEQHRGIARDKGLSLHLCADTSLRVSADRALVAIVVGNLLDNAIRYTETGHVTVRIGPTSVSIEDTGPGMADDERERIFERHYRAPSSRGIGSGLGLSIVRRICESRGWRIGIDTREGQGTTAVVTFLP